MRGRKKKSDLCGRRTDARGKRKTRFPQGCDTVNALHKCLLNMCNFTVLIIAFRRRLQRPSCFVSCSIDHVFSGVPRQEAASVKRIVPVSPGSCTVSEAVMYFAGGKHPASLPVLDAPGQRVDGAAGLSLAARHQHGPIRSRVHGQGRRWQPAAAARQRQAQGQCLVSIPGHCGAMCGHPRTTHKTHTYTTHALTSNAENWLKKVRAPSVWLWYVQRFNGVVSTHMVWVSHAQVAQTTTRHSHRCCGVVVSRKGGEGEGLCQNTAQICKHDCVCSCVTTSVGRKETLKQYWQATSFDVCLAYCRR